MTTAVPREMPDIETSSDGYASRFTGAAGRYMLSVQEQGVASLMRADPSLAGGAVLDVGGGHAQLAGPMTRLGCKVTVLGSDEACAARLRSDPLGSSIDFIAGDLLALPVADRGMDAIVSVRLISHMEDWRGLVGELCRVARRSVIIDYPTLASLNALSLITFPLKQAIEKNTRTYRSFRPAELRDAFAGHGFQPSANFKQFVAPMAAHRLLGRTGLVRGAEAGLRAAGVTSLLGNPVLARFDRVAA